MARTSPPIELEEVSGKKFSSLDSARQFSRSIIAVSLAETIKKMLENGLLEIKDNKIQPKE
ncbi:MAG: hypothetical protein KF758_07600 [Anaerolineales bacterium]|nr:hypothetical protein [Anaerolineales bacterium]